MRRRRNKTGPRDLTRGPARLCEAFSIDRVLDGWDLTRGERLWLCADREPSTDSPRLATATRVGVTSGEDLVLRFLVKGSPFVSTPRPRPLKQL